MPAPTTQHQPGRIAPAATMEMRKREQDQPTRVTARVQRSLAVYRDTLPFVLRHPAAWILAALLVAGCATLVVSGHGGDVLSNLPVWMVMLLTLVALPLTADAPAGPEAKTETPQTKARWKVQVAAVLLVLAFIASLTYIRYHIIQAQVPLLTPITNWLLGSMEPLGNAPTFGDLVIPLLYFVVPLVVLVPLGVKWRDMGFGRGNRSWTAIALFGVPLVVLIALALAGDGKSPLVLLFLLSQNNLRNGYFEEFLFRGPLLNRLTAPNITWEPFGVQRRLRVGRT